MGLTFDGPNRLIICTPGTVQISVVDVYSRWKDWVRAGNAQFLEAFLPVGGDPIDASAGTSIPLYAFLVNGWRMRPQEASHTLTVAGGVLLVGGGGDPLVGTLGAFNVRVNYQQPVQAIGVSGGGVSASDVAAAVWARVVESGLSAQDLQRLMAAVLLGRLSGAGSGTETIKAAGGTKDRVVSTVDGAGNRTAVALDASD